MGLELQQEFVGGTNIQFLTIMELHCLFPMFLTPGAQLSKQPIIEWEPLGMRQVYNAHLFSWSLGDAVESWMTFDIPWILADPVHRSASGV